MPDTQLNLARALSRYLNAKDTRNGAYASLCNTIREAYASGMTYQSIGEAVGLTRQRVAKICETRKGEE